MSTSTVKRGNLQDLACTSRFNNALLLAPFTIHTSPKIPALLLSQVLPLQFRDTFVFTLMQLIGLNHISHVSEAN